MHTAHEKVVEAQFGPRAKAYVESAVHAKGEDLDALEIVVRELRPRRGWISAPAAGTCPT